MISSHARVENDPPLVAANSNTRDPWMRLAALEAANRSHEPMIGAAILVATAFRLRDEPGLIASLRCLAQAVDAFEQAEGQAAA